MQSMQELINERTARFLNTAQVRLPIMNAPMADASGPEMAAAVCRAGGLGVLAGDELEPKALSEAIDEVRRLAGENARFAVNIRVAPAKKATAEQQELQRKMLDALEDLAADVGVEAGTTLALPDFDAQFDVLVQKQVPVVSVTFGGLREEYDDRLKQAGMLWMGTATTLREAKVLRAAGADIVVVQGIEAGGPRLNFENTSEEAVLGMSVLVAHASRATQLPVVASGGIGTPDQVYAALAAGAGAVMVGSVLLRTFESRVSSAFKDLLPLVSDVSMRLTSCFNGRPTRVYPTDLVRALEESGLRFAPYPLQREVMRPILSAARFQGREDLACLPAGQVAMLAREESVEQALNRLMVFVVN